jgi:N-formylglutamate amidohydrolase
MFVLIFFFIGFTSSDLITSRFYFSGYRNSFKAIPLHLSNTNLILSSPHAGSDMPDDIPDRTDGGCRRNNSNVCTFYFNDTCSNGNRCSVTTVQDFADFDPFAERIVEELYRKYKILPFAIIAKWNRKKIDFNREINEATFNHPEAMKSHSKYHNYLQKAIKKIKQKFNGKGLLLDLHQHAQGK